MSWSFSSRYTLLAGFSLLLALLLGISVLGLARTEQVNRRLHDVIEEQDAKTRLVSVMLNVARERGQLMVQLFNEQPPDARARSSGRYVELGREFDAVTGQLSAMPLSRDERAALQNLLDASRRTQDVRDEVVELVLAGDTTSARRILYERGIGTHYAFQESMYLLLDKTREATMATVAEARDSTRYALTLIAAIGGLVLVGATLVATLVTRQVKRTEYALQLEKELAQVTLHSIGDGVITTDAGGKVEYLNPVAEQYTGWTTKDARGKALADIYRVIDERTGKGLEALSSVNGVPVDENDHGAAVSVRLIDRNGRECPIRYSHAPIRNREGRVLGMIVVFHDISQIRAMAQQLLWQASHDALTGLVNRREFERRLAELIDTARTQGREHALMFMDLDNFKAVNDTCGHSAGDELLRQLTSVMLARMRGSDTLARLGGDEFAALLESCPYDQAVRIANAMRETVREFRFVSEDKTFTVGVSIGLVPLTAETGDLNRVLSLADACCYEAKNRGRDRVQVYRPDEGEATGKHGELQVVSQINQAFEMGRFRLYRQRIVSLAPGPQTEPNYEVLVRMIDRSGNLIPPTGFMPAAERYNLLTSIERWVISSLIEYLHNQWAAGAIPRDASQRGYYSVNLSGASINDKSLPDFLHTLLRRYQLPAGLLCFEITETTAISNLNAAAELMTELKGMGCRFALDDFGTGMSSFAYLKYLPVDVLKIAGMFVKDMATDEMDFAIIDAINRIGHILGMETVAEEVEDADTLEKISNLGIDFAQGYFIAAPEAILHGPTGQPVELTSA
ncbi:MAG TPA: EAL domain-containing protein [Burkholderiales bacterium]|nr:EAL domain-containing protein [Burkholderiales bacterium]